jgi:hypothetical protein
MIVKKGEWTFTLLMVAEPIGGVVGEDVVGYCEKRSTARQPFHGE